MCISTLYVFPSCIAMFFCISYRFSTIFLLFLCFSNTKLCFCQQNSPIFGGVVYFFIPENSCSRDTFAFAYPPNLRCAYVSFLLHYSGWRSPSAWLTGSEKTIDCALLSSPACSMIAFMIAFLPCAGVTNR